MDPSAVEASRGADDPRALRIVLFSNNYRPRVSGVAVAVEFLERALRAAGHRTLVVAPDYDPARPDGRSGVVRVRSLPLKPWRAALPLPRRRALASEIARFRPHLLHSHHPYWLGHSAVLSARKLRVPLVYTFHTFYEAFLESARLDFRPLVRLVRKGLRRYIRHCTLVVAPTEPVRDWMAGELAGGVPTATAPTGLNPERFTSIDPGEGVAFRDRLGVSPESALLIWAGRVTSEKNPALAVETLAALRAGGRDAALVFIGRGPAERAVEERARSLGVVDHLRVAGFVQREQLPAALASGDLFLFTSWNDTQAIVAYEAWAAGLRLVSVRSLAGRALVQDGRNGILAAGDARSFADAAESLLRHGELCREPFPWNRFGPEALAAHWSELYLGAIERHVAGATARPAAGDPAKSRRGALAAERARAPAPNVAK